MSRPRQILIGGTKAVKFFRKLLPLSLICIFAFTTATHAADGCSAAAFKVAPTIILEATPFGMAVADFNSDGHLDLAVSPNNVDGEVMILLGRGGTEKFGPPTTFPVGGLPRRMAAGDFNGDGKPDLAVSLDGFAESPRKLSILINDGTGKFGAPTLIDIAGDPVQPVLGDLNNDGKLDIAVGLSTGTTDGKVAILLGNGSGGFSQAANSPFSTFSTTAGQLAIGDFKEDGKLDLAIPNSSGGADILPGDGAGGFTVGPPPQISGGALTLTAGDFNEDGHLDVLVENRMFLGTGTGTFGAPTVIGIQTITNAARAGDVNNDGHLDVVAGGQSGLTILLGNGTGNLVQAKSYTSGFTIFGAGSSFAALGDFNEDGKVDLAAVQPRGVGILDGDGTGAFNDALSYQTTIPNPDYLVAADFNNDGKQDFVTASAAFLPFGSTIEVAHGDGNGGFTKKSINNFGVSQPTAIATADFNGDGKLDLAVTQRLTGKISILLNDGTGGFATDASNAPSVLFAAQPSAITAGDFNNDNKADLIVLSSSTSNFLVLLGTGTGTFTTSLDGQLQGTSSFNDELAVGDFNADGKSDFAVVRGGGGNVVKVMQGDGTGDFSDYALLSLPGIPASVVVRDLNGDGKPDIAANSGAIENGMRRSEINVFINNGAGGFNPSASYPVDGADFLAIGDFNSDNHPDLAASSGMDGLTVLTNKGNGQFNAAVYFSTGSTSSHLAVADFNNDGKDDALFSQLTGNNIGLALNNFSFPQPCLSINDVTVTETDSGTVNAVFTVTLSSPTEQIIKVNYFTVATGTINAPPATKGVDFENVSGTLIFPFTSTTQTITVPIKSDVTDEFDQFFNVVLTTPVNAAISDGKGLGTITDNDGPPAIAINDVTVAEGTENQTSANFTLTLNAPSEKPITVPFALQAGTATSGVDYVNISGTVDFPAGTTTRFINVPITQDNTFEPDETFFVNLSNATNATITDNQGQGTITNDDPQPSIVIAVVFHVEGGLGTSGNALLEVRLSNPSSQTITVAFSTADATATAGIDYVATSGTLTFNPGETVKSIAVEVLGDNIDEQNEQIFVNLTNPTNATVGTVPGFVTILDDDNPTVSVSDASVIEGNTGTRNAVFTVTLSAPTVQDVLVNYGTAPGTAFANFDFLPILTNTLLIPAGATSATFNVRVVGDFFIEPDEQFTVHLLFTNNATIADGVGTGTIVNDDPPLFLALEEAALDPNQVAAFDSMLMLRDPFPVVNPLNLLFGQGTDRNTRVVVFVTNLQLAPNDVASIVRVVLTASNGQIYDLEAQDVRMTPVSNLSQITFRLPDNLAPGICAIKIKVRDQESNQGNIRIQ